MICHFRARLAPSVRGKPMPALDAYVNDADTRCGLN